ncbi:hypothetical protein BGZ46_009067, partial [Entomortierella lignicola]
MIKLPSFDISFRQLILASFALHAVLLAYGHWQDTHLVVKYTDIDYVVFTDASRYLTQGYSPYKRATYRYTPLLAHLLTPNIYFHESFGKWIFTGANLLIGILIQKILRLRGMSESRAVKFNAIWLLNPMVANISTRGNAESVIGAMVLGSFYLIMKKRIGWGAFLYGLSVHFKTYPIIYSVALLVLMDDGYGGSRVSDDQGEKSTNATTGVKRSKSNIVARTTKDIIDFITWRRVKFGLMSGGWFFLITGLMYYIYGYEFLFETYLYHVTRKDHRHNFSFWFYNIYLTFTSPTGTLVGVLTFVPQLALVLAIGFCFGKDIFFCAFLQTFAFVAWNKVCTAQYFMWYIVFLPLLIPCLAANPRMSLKSHGRNMLIAWGASQGLWLSQAYNLEFLGLNTFWNLFLASAIMYASNVWILIELITQADYEPIFDSRGVIRRAIMSTALGTPGPKKRKNAAAIPSLPKPKKQKLPRNLDSIPARNQLPNVPSVGGISKTGQRMVKGPYKKREKKDKDGKKIPPGTAGAGAVAGVGAGAGAGASGRKGKTGKPGAVNSQSSAAPGGEGPAGRADASIGLAATNGTNGGDNEGQTATQRGEVGDAIGGGEVGEVGAEGKEDDDDEHEEEPEYTEYEWNQEANSRGRSKEELRALLDRFSDEQLQRYEVYRRSVLSKSTVKKASF